MVVTTRPCARRVPAASVFHRFPDLPVELRRQVYEQYFLDEDRSLACEAWLHSKRARINVWRIRHSFNTKFLPNLCLANRLYGGEAIDFLLQSTKFSIHGRLEAQFFLREVNNFTSINILGKMKKLILDNVDDLSTIPYRDTRDQDAIFHRIRESNRVCNDLLTRCNSLRTLRLHLFYSTCDFPDRPRASHQSEDYRTIAIENSLLDFDTRIVLEMAEIQRIVLHATVPYRLSVHQLERNFISRKFYELAHHLKTGFTKLGREVIVHARLKHVEDDDYDCGQVHAKNM